MANFASKREANCVFLKKDDDGNILLCDELGTPFGGQFSVEVRNAVNEITSARVEFYVSGWIEDDH